MTLASCGSNIGPSDTVERVRVCRACGDSERVTPSYQNGNPGLPGTQPFDDGDCFTWDLTQIAGSDTYTGADTVSLPYTLASDPERVLYARIPLAEATFHMACE